jgi:hypothetical protein
MSHEVAKTLYDDAHEARQKFEYFITGAIGAMFAYTVQNYTPRRLDLTPSTLEPIAIVCLAVAFFCALKRIESHYHHLGINYEKNQALGDAKALEEALRLIHTDPVRHQPRQSIEEIQKSLEIQVSRAKSAAPILDMLDRRMGKLYHLRNYLMAAGFLLIFCAKAGSPYFAPTKTQSQEPQTKDQRTPEPQQKATDSQPPTANKTDAGNGS